MKKKTIVSFILDSSGSMSSCLDATVSGYNEYVGTLKADKKSAYDFSLTLFNTEVEARHSSLPIGEIPELTHKTYVPGGFTALYDAVMKTVNEVEKKAGKDKVLCIIMTDGGENASREYTQKDLFNKVKELEKTGKWTFVFLGANQDSWAVAQNFGFAQANVANYQTSSLGMSNAFRSVASNTVAYAASADFSTQSFFSDEDKKNLEVK